MYDRKDYYYDPVHHYYTYDPDGAHARQAENESNSFDGGSYSSYAEFSSNDNYGGYGAYTSEPYGGYDSYDGYDGSKGKKPKKPKKTVNLTKSKLVALMLVMILLAGAAGFGGARLAGAGKVTISQNDSTMSSTGYDLQKSTGSKMSIQQIAAKCQESVVSIRTESVSQGSWIQEYVTEGAGSGVIFKSDGYIITNNHVVEGARKVTVTVDSSNGKTKDYEAQIIGTDAENDVAVLKINAKNLTAADIGKSKSVSVGDMAVVVGNPLGELGDSVSAGIISSTSRTVTVENQRMKLMQTDASVNPGNSGGGLFNGSGQMIGLVVAKSSGTGIEGLGFAIPIDTAVKSAQNIMDGKVNDNAQNSQNDQNQQYDQNQGNDYWNDNGNNGNNGGNGGNDYWNDNGNGGQNDYWNDNGGLFDYFF
jgi:serine protease Do